MVSFHIALLECNNAALAFEDECKPVALLVDGRLLRGPLEASERAKRFVILSKGNTIKALGK